MNCGNYIELVGIFDTFQLSIIQYNMVSIMYNIH